MISFSSVVVIAAVALVAPLSVGLMRLRVPGVVVEILLGVAIGPHVLGWARADMAVTVLSTIGLSFLLLLAGLEVDFARLRGRLLAITFAAFGASFAIAALTGVALRLGGIVRSPLLLAIILSATSLGVITPILKDADQTETPFGRVVMAGASIGEVAPIVLLSLLFSGSAGGAGSKLVLLIAFLAFVAAIGLAVRGIERSTRLSETLLRLQDTTAEIRVRGAFLLLIVFAFLATKLGLEAILGAFLAGATIKLIDHDQAVTHAFFHQKLQAAGFGIFIPAFFITTGIKLDVTSLTHSASTITRVPIFLAALLAARALPTLAYRRFAQRRSQIIAAGLLQATSLTLPVVAGQIGVDLHLIRPENYVALVFAGLLSVILFPALALPLLGKPPAAPPPPKPAGSRYQPLGPNRDSSRQTSGGRPRTRSR
jgi:Kef-type K+ transport system membrane component KefB